jgi:hypothetical protein
MSGILGGAEAEVILKSCINRQRFRHFRCCGSRAALFLQLLDLLF